MKNFNPLALLALAVAVATPAFARPVAVSDQHPMGVNVAEPRQNYEACWVGDVPEGFEDQIAKIKITNERTRPVTIEIDGSPIQIRKRRRSNEAHKPHGIIVDVDGKEELQTILWPGDTCYIAPRPKSMQMMRDEGYKVKGQDVSMGVVANQWLPVHACLEWDEVEDEDTGEAKQVCVRVSKTPTGYKTANDGFLTEACEVDKVKYRGKQMPVVFLPSNLEDFDDGC